MLMGEHSALSVTMGDVRRSAAVDIGPDGVIDDDASISVFYDLLAAGAAGAAGTAGAAGAAGAEDELDELFHVDLFLEMLTNGDSDAPVVDARIATPAGSPAQEAQEAQAPAPAPVQKKAGPVGVPKRQRKRTICGSTFNPQLQMMHYCEMPMGHLGLCGSVRRETRRH